MKKTGLMEVAFGDAIVKCDAKKGMIDLLSVMETGNKLRVEKELPLRELREFWSNKDTKEFVEELYLSEFSNGEFPVEEIELLDYEFMKSKLTESSGRGRSRKVFGHLYLALKLGAWLDKKLEVEIYKTFVEGKLMPLRINGADKYNELRDKIQFIPYRAEKDSHKGFMIQISNRINRKVNGEFISGWDHKEADKDKQAHRDRILTLLIQMVDMNMINCNEDMYKFIEGCK